MGTLEDVPTADEFGFNVDSWMKSDITRKSEIYAFCQAFVDRFVDFSYSTVNERSQDDVNNYATEVISLGLFYFNYKDVVKEGAGKRLEVCWKYLLPLFKGSDKRNYSGEVLRMLYSYNYTLSLCQTHQLLYSRFVNTHGVPGRNIAGDLHMEHLNRSCKDAIRGLGANKTEKSITRIGKALGPLMSVMSNYDTSVVEKELKASRHKVASAEKDMKLIMNELMGRANVFEEVDGRKFKHGCALQKSLFHKMDHKAFEGWIEETVNSWK